MDWASSPTTMRLRSAPKSRSTISAWRRLVSWYSSTSTWRKRAANAWRTSGKLRSSKSQLRSKSS